MYNWRIIRMHVVIIRVYVMHIRTYSHSYAHSYSQPTTNMFAYLRLIMIPHISCCSRTSIVHCVVGCRTLSYINVYIPRQWFSPLFQQFLGFDCGFKMFRKIVKELSHCKFYVHFFKYVKSTTKATNSLKNWCSTTSLYVRQTTFYLSWFVANRRT